MHLGDLCIGWRRKILRENTNFIRIRKIVFMQIILVIYLMHILICLHSSLFAFTAQLWNSPLWDLLEPRAEFCTVTSALVLSLCDNFFKDRSWFCFDWLYDRVLQTSWTNFVSYFGLKCCTPYSNASHSAIGLFPIGSKLLPSFIPRRLRNIRDGLGFGLVVEALSISFYVTGIRAWFFGH